VHGHGFSFEAPAGWAVTTGPRQTRAAHDSELVQVATFPLLKAYRPTLFARVEVELKARMAVVARQTGGQVDAGRTVDVGGVRSHSFRVTTGDHVDEYTFVLRGRSEFQLLCRRVSTNADTFCARLLSSFRSG
jgi:hypothetical protein